MLGMEYSQICLGYFLKTFHVTKTARFQGTYDGMMYTKDKSQIHGYIRVKP